MIRRAPAFTAAAILAYVTACGGSSSTTRNDTGGSSGMPGTGARAGTPNEGGSSGTAGAGAGAGAQSGTANVGGTSDSTGGASSGGATGAAAGATGGAAGAAGAPPGVGAVAEIDSACDTPGELACAGNHQRVTLICLSGTWQRNETCPENHACDTTPGFDQGTCKERLAECASVEPGHRFCNPGATAVMACGPDNVTLELIEECTGVCIDAVCDNRPNHCPVGEYMNCGSECRERDAGCSTGCTVGLNYVEFRTIRTPTYADLCAASCNSNIHEMVIPMPPVFAVKITAPTPWRIAVDDAYSTGSGDVCTVDSSENCLVLERGEALQTFRVYVFTDDPTAAEGNVNFQIADYNEQLQCP